MEPLEKAHAYKEVTIHCNFVTQVFCAASQNVLLHLVLQSLFCITKFEGKAAQGVRRQLRLNPTTVEVTEARCFQCCA